MHAIMISMPNIVLSEEQKQRLTDLTQSVTDQVRRRARLILAYAEGKPTLQAARQAEISRGRARYWKRQFLSKGMDIFHTIVGDVARLENTEQAENVAIENQITSSEDQVADGRPPIPEEPAYPPVQAVIGIKADDSLAEAGKKVWLYHFALMLQHENGTLLGEDAEELHDMRVATRRMRTAFDIFGEAFEPKIMKRYLKGLRAIGRALGQVRDMDVILENAVKYQKKVGNQQGTGLEALIASWEDVIVTKRKKLTRHMESDEYDEFKREFNQFLQEPSEDSVPGKRGIEAALRTRDIVPALIYNRYANVRAYDAIVPSGTVSQLHALRIEFKKLRYTLEYFKEILAEIADSAIEEIKRYQDHLGELHDADVGCQLVRDFLKDWDENQSGELISMRANPEPVVTYLAHLHSERYRLMSSFPEKWQYFNRPEFRQKLAQAISPL